MLACARMDTGRTAWLQLRGAVTNRIPKGLTGTPRGVLRVDEEGPKYEKTV